MPRIVAKIDSAAKCGSIPGGGWENRSSKDHYNLWAFAVAFIGYFVPILGLLGLFLPGRTREVRIKTGSFT